MRPGALFHIRPKVKIQFFDRNIIRTRWRRINNPLAAAGALVMRIARHSIKRRKKKVSSAGSPPFSHQPGALPPFKMIFFKVHNLGTSVIVGMVGFGGQPAVPGLHEHGGVARRKVFSRLGQRRLKSGRMGRVAYSYKPKLIKYPQRAFMVPALLRARSRLPNLWRGAISR